MSLPYRLQIASENAIIIYFEQRIGADIADQVQQAGQQIAASMAEALIDLLPSYASLLVVFNPVQLNHQTATQRITQALQHSAKRTQQQGKVIELPVYYSEQSGPDLARIAERSGLNTEEVIRRHQAITYRVYAIGFAPGFAYLGEVDPMLETPRLASPRARVPAGAVAIADRQTAVYPAASPGGWNLIGLCPQKMFNPAAKPVMPVAVGDEVRFVAISKADYLQRGGLL